MVREINDTMNKEMTAKPAKIANDQERITRQAEAEDMKEAVNDESKDISADNDVENDNLAAGSKSGATADAKEGVVEEDVFNKDPIIEWVYGQLFGESADVPEHPLTAVFKKHKNAVKMHVYVSLKVVKRGHPMPDFDVRDHVTMEEYDNAWARGESPRDTNNFLTIRQRYIDLLQQQKRIVQKWVNACWWMLGFPVSCYFEQWRNGSLLARYHALYYAGKREVELVNIVDRLNFFAENDP